MKRNILGICLSGLYVVATLACWATAYFAAGDVKGQFVLRQLPIAPIAALIDGLGFANLISGFTWVEAYAVLFPLSLGLLYSFGWLVTQLLGWPLKKLLAARPKQQVQPPN
jgi:hypothetical protein